MSKEPRHFMARSVNMFKCENCRGIHVQFCLNDSTDAVAVLDPEDWATMLMQDDEFVAAVSARLGRN